MTSTCWSIIPLQWRERKAARAGSGLPHKTHCAKRIEMVKTNDVFPTELNECFSFLHSRSFNGFWVSAVLVSIPRPPSRQCPTWMTGASCQLNSSTVCVIWTGFRWGNGSFVCGRGDSMDFWQILILHEGGWLWSIHPSWLCVVVFPPLLFTHNPQRGYSGNGVV